MKYDICIEVKENLYRTIEAENEDEASSKALQDWNDGKDFETEVLGPYHPDMEDVFATGVEK